MSQNLKPILLAEDSLDDQRLFMRIINQAGVDNPVHIVHDGDEAIDYLRGAGAFSDRENYPLPCALFLDLRMRRVDGWEVLRWIQSQSHLTDMLVVVLTVFDDQRAIQEAYQLGAHSFLIKPFELRDVRNLATHFRRALSRISAMLTLA